LAALLSREAQQLWVLRERRARLASQQAAQTDWRLQKEPAKIPQAFEQQVCLPPQVPAVLNLNLFPKGR